MQLQQITHNQPSIDSTTKTKPILIGRDYMVCENFFIRSGIWEWDLLKMGIQMHEILN